MPEERMRILKMVSEGKITTEEAEDLLDAINQESPKTGNQKAMDLRQRVPQYLKIQVEPKPGSDKSDRVNVKIPTGIIRAGMKFSSFLPKGAKEKIDTALDKKGIAFALSDLNTENLEEFMATMSDMSIDVDSDNESVKIFFE